jgi:uncharacterized protein (DUF1697 family)
MTQYVAFLRAINVGGHTVKMPELQRLFEDMGFSNVATFIASGNVIFESAVGDPRELEQTIEKGLQEALGYEVVTFLRTLPEVAAIAAAVADHKPFPEEEFEAGAVLYIVFVRDPLSDELHERLMSLRNEIDEFHVRGPNIYWLHRKQLMKPGKPADAPIEKTLKIPATIRNVNTIRRIAAKYCRED